MYAIGIDTGGTYTDSVIVNAESGEIVASAKSPTTHYKLSVGLEKSLTAVMEKSGIDPSEVGTVSVSTTLATNAIVEDKGARVGLFMIGPVKAVRLPVVTVNYITGGHKFSGAEDDPLDVEKLVDGINDMRGYVDAYAVCAAMSFKNPAHELVAAKAISLADPGKAVFCSHEISTKAGQAERAATAVLNARLMPVMKKFLEGVSSALIRCHLGGSVVVIRGNATPMSMEDAVSRAAETFASGPASTAYYGSLYTPEENSLIVDVGGTTTDVTLIKNSRPTINEDGSIIGKWETHVEAVEMFTVGIGGDSYVKITDSGILNIGPARVIPLCMAGDIPDPSKWMGKGDNSRLIRKGPAADEPGDDKILQTLFADGPATYGELITKLGIPDISLGSMIEFLVREQLVEEIGFTPTDALHVQGKIELGDASKSVSGAAVLGAVYGQDAETFAENVLENVYEKIENAMLEHIVRKEIGGNMAGIIAGRSASPLVSFEASLNLPIVGIGAPASYLLPDVAERLKTKAVFPEYHEVGNALGAVMMALKESK
jgi:N-methylhydantoinase A/oxoprolinase/acetone carboxylase beta subunit